MRPENENARARAVALARIRYQAMAVRQAVGITLPTAADIEFYHLLPDAGISEDNYIFVCPDAVTALPTFRWRGASNVVIIGPRCSLEGSTIVADGSSGLMIFGADVQGENCALTLHNADNRILVGAGTTMQSAKVTVRENGCAVHIGDGCLLSPGATISTSDSQPIRDRATGQRLNPGASVTLGSGVWLGDGVRVAKGVRLGHGGAVEPASIVVYDTEPNSLYSGAPAKLMRADIKWGDEIPPRSVQLADAPNPAPAGMRLLYEGPDIVVRADFEQPGKDLLISFVARSNELPKKGFGEDFCAARGIPSVHFLSRRPIWWQTKDMEAALAAVKQAVDRSRYRSICGYGASMGAFGALVFSRALQLDRIVAFAPQASINGRGAPWRREWEKDTRHVQEIYRVEDALPDSLVEVIILYDPLYRFDRLHLAALAPHLPNARRIVVPYSLHNTASVLKAAGILGVAIAGLIDGTYGDKSVRQMVRAGRTQSISYWNGLIEEARKRGKRSLATAAETRRHELLLSLLDSGALPRNQEPFSIALTAWMNSRIAAGSVEEAAALVQRYVQVAPQSSMSHLTAAQMLILQKKPAEALPFASRAMKLDRGNQKIRAFVIQLLLQLGRVDDAIHLVRKCLNKPVGVKLVTWRSIHSSIRSHQVPEDVLQSVAAHARLL